MTVFRLVDTDLFVVGVCILSQDTEVFKVLPIENFYQALFFVSFICLVCFPCFVFFLAHSINRSKAVFVQ